MKIIALAIDANPSAQQQFAVTKIPLYRVPTKKEIYALDRVVPIALGSPNIDVQMASYDIFLAYLDNNADTQLSIASTLLPLSGPQDEVTIGNNIMNAFFKKDNAKTYMIASMMLNVILKNASARYVFFKQVNTTDDKTFLEVFVETVATTDDKTKALSLLKLLVTVTNEANNELLLALMNETLFTYLLLKSSDSDLFHSSLACIILFNVLNELKFNSAPNTNTEMIDKISRAIDTIGFEKMKRKLECLLASKEFADAEANGISAGLLFDRESVRFISKIVGSINEKKECGEAKLKEREMTVLKEEVDELRRRNDAANKELKDTQCKMEELQAQLDLERSLNDSATATSNNQNELEAKVAEMEGELNVAKATTEELQKRCETLEKEKDELMQDKLAMQEQQQKLSGAIARCEKEKETLQTEADAFKQKVVEESKKNEERELGKMQTQVAMLTERVEKLTNDLKMKGTEIGQLEAELAQKDAQLLEAKERSVKTERETLLARQELSDSNAEKEKLAHEFEEYRKTISGHSDEQKALEDELDSKNDELLLVKMQLEEYENVNDQLTNEKNQLQKKLEEVTQQLAAIRASYEANPDVLDSFGEETPVPTTQAQTAPVTQQQTNTTLTDAVPSQQQESTKTTEPQPATPSEGSLDTTKETQQDVTKDPTTGGVQMPTITISDVVSTFSSIFK